MTDSCTEERFLSDVAGHEMTVIRDDGVHRHIRFRKPGTMNMQFDFITWPGYLCYCGDMGTFVFRRTNDMFEFFRTDRDYAQRQGRRLAINLGYWSEKLEAVDGSRRGGSAKEYSEEKFVRIIKEQLVTWWRERDLDREQRKELREAVEGEILDRLGDVPQSSDRAHELARDFDARIGGTTFEFRDFWEYDLTDYSYHFVWCCFALAWGIEQYDNARVEVPA